MLKFSLSILAVISLSHRVSVRFEVSCVGSNFTATSSGNGDYSPFLGGLDLYKATIPAPPASSYLLNANFPYSS